jgi:predicted metalloprotease with PDZ domain
MNRNRSRLRRAVCLLGCGALFTACAAAQSPAPIAYTVSLTSPEHHLLQVQIVLPSGAAQRELQLPVWNALYQVRDFSQYINWIRAKNRAGQAIDVREINDSRWRIENAADGAIVEYQVYADVPGPFGAQLNTHHAFFNLAEILMYPVDGRASPVSLQFSQLPSEWRAAMPIRATDLSFHVENYDRLVDSPAEIGRFQESDFDESGGHFRVIIDADPGDYDTQKIIADLHRIVAAAISWMKDRPFETYTFFYHFPRGPGGGGMEHANSTAIEISSEAMRRNLDALDSVSAHEFFHLWNVKRIRPQSLEPIDYTKENFTRSLWFSEGVTSTAEGIFQLRAGLLSERQYLDRLGDEITELERRPAHLAQSAEDSSLDAWLEGFSYYRRPERSISYYNKGELLGIMLDLAVRDSTAGRASLREVLQWMNANYAKKGLFFDDSNGVRRAAEAVSHADLASFFTRYVSGTEEIPWDDFLRSVGLHVEAATVTTPDPGFTASRNFDGPMAVVAVTPDSEAQRAGLQAGDTIIELQGQPAGQESRQQLARLNPGDSISVKVQSRRAGERQLKWKVEGRQEIQYKLENLDPVSVEQRARRAAWLEGEAQNPSAAPEATGK